MEIGQYVADNFRLRVVFPVAVALLIGIQLVRLLQVAPPSLDLGDSDLVALSFANAACRADRLLTLDEYTDKWSFHPGDGGAQGVCVSGDWRTGQRPGLLVRYAGNPGDPGIRAGLDIDGDGRIDLPWTLGAAARRGWLVAAVPLPPEARQRNARLIIEDRSLRPDGWLIVRNIVEFAGTARGLEGVESWPRVPVAIGAALLALCALWFARHRQMLLVAVAIAGLLSLEFLQVSSFYLHDEYTLLGTYSDGLRWHELVSYYDQFMPIFLALFAASVALVGEWYGPLQAAMLAGHVAVTLTLVKLLLRHGFAPLLSVALGLLYATAWVHADVVPWFIEGCFLVSTWLILIAIERTSAYLQGNGRALAWAALAAGVAPFVFAGGAVAPWLCLAYMLIFSPRDRVALVLLAAIGVATSAVILLASPALESAGVVAGEASPADMLAFIVTGTLAGSLAPLLALRGSATVAVAGLAAAGMLILTLAGAGRNARWLARSLAFGVAWLISAYALQAIVRTNTAFGDAMTLRYTYLGMTGAAFVVATVLQPLATAWSGARERLRRPLAGALLAATVAAAGGNVSTYIGATEIEQREYFDISRQYFALTRAALSRARAHDYRAPGALLPKTVYPGNQSATPAELTAQFRFVVCYLADCGPVPTAGGEAIAGDPARPVWDALLTP